MPIVSADIEYRLSGGGTNSDPNASLGGAKSGTTVAPSTLFDNVSSAESSSGDVEYRCVYVHNDHATLTAQNVVIWIQANTAGNRIAIGLGSSAIAGVEQSVANEGAAPTGVTFSQPGTQGTALAIGNLAPGEHKAVWIRRNVPAGTGAANDTFNLRTACDTAA